MGTPQNIFNNNWIVVCLTLFFLSSSLSLCSPSSPNKQEVAIQNISAWAELGGDSPQEKEATKSTDKTWSTFQNRKMMEHQRELERQEKEERLRKEREQKEEAKRRAEEQRKREQEAREAQRLKEAQDAELEAQRERERLRLAAKLERERVSSKTSNALYYHLPLTPYIPGNTKHQHDRTEHADG